MSKRKKRVEKARNAPDNLSFEELCTLAEQMGFVQDGGKGDHAIYKHPDFPEAFMNFQSWRGKAKGYQVRQLLAFHDEHLADRDDAADGEE